MSCVPSGALHASRRNNLWEGPPRARSRLTLPQEIVPGHCPSGVQATIRQGLHSAFCRQQAGCSPVGTWLGGGVRHPTVPHPTVPANTHHPLGIHQAPTSQPLLADTRQGQMTVVALGRTHPYPSSTAEGASPSSCLSLESLCAAPQLGRGGAESRKPTTKALWAQKPVQGRLRSRRWLISSNNEQRFRKTP